VIEWVVDKAFTFFMWTLLDPEGRNFFYAMNALIILGCLSLLYFTRDK
jgi:hypothetical protein